MSLGGAKARTEAAGVGVRMRGSLTGEVGAGRNAPAPREGASSSPGDRRMREGGLAIVKSSGMWNLTTFVHPCASRALRLGILGSCCRIRRVKAAKSRARLPAFGESGCFYSGAVW